MQYTHLDFKNSEPCKYYWLLKTKVPLVLCRFPSLSPALSSFSEALRSFPLVPLVLPFPFRVQDQSAWPLLPHREDRLAPPEHWAQLGTPGASLHICVLSRPVKSSICGNLISSLQWSISLLRLFPSQQNYLFLGEIFWSVKFCLSVALEYFFPTKLH